MTDEYLYYHDGYLVYTSGYRTFMHRAEHQRWDDLVTSNQSLAPEIIGVLLGRAEPIRVKVLCKVCQKEIKQPEAAKSRAMTFPEERLIEAHQTCYDKERKEQGLSPT